MGSMNVGALNKQVSAWTGLAITVVVASVVLLNFKSISGVTASLNTTIDTFVSAFSEPANWVAITIIALIGFALLKMYSGKR